MFAQPPTAREREHIQAQQLSAGSWRTGGEARFCPLCWGTGSMTAWENLGETVEPHWGTNLVQEEYGEFVLEGNLNDCELCMGKKKDERLLKDHTSKKNKFSARPMTLRGVRSRLLRFLKGVAVLAVGLLRAVEASSAGLDDSRGERKGTQRSGRGGREG